MAPRLRLILLCGVAIFFALGPIAAAVDNSLARYGFRESSLTQWKLPSKLREISGLVFHDERLFTHDDQFGIVYEMSLRDAQLVKAFALGKKTVRADFEGIAAVGNTFYLVTSNGRIYRAPEGQNGERVAFKSFNTGLGRRCEVEGLVYDSAKNRLLLVCKEARSDELRQHVAIFSWSLSEQRIIEKDTILVALSPILKQIRKNSFNPSGIEIDKTNGHLLLIAARQYAIAEIDADGKLISAFQLPLAKRHRQTEGIALTSSGELILADEGGDKKARLAIYHPEN